MRAILSQTMAHATSVLNPNISSNARNALTANAQAVRRSSCGSVGGAAFFFGDAHNVVVGLTMGPLRCLVVWGHSSLSVVDLTNSLCPMSLDSDPSKSHRHPAPGAPTIAGAHTSLLNGWNKSFFLHSCRHVRYEKRSPTFCPYRLLCSRHPRETRTRPINSALMYFLPSKHKKIFSF